MKKGLCILMVLAWLVAPMWATDYATPRQQAMAAFLELDGLDTLSVGEHTNYSYKTHPLSIRVNEWKEIEHIGFKLFNRAGIQGADNVVMDFLERYLLEKIAAKDTDHAIRLGFDNVTFNTGTPEDVFRLSGNEDFYSTCVSMTSYSVEWRKNDKTILSITFDMDYQLLTGCNAIQLEEVFLKKLKRFEATETSMCAQQDFPDSDYYIKEGNFFLIDAINNNLHFRKEDGEWKLMTGGKSQYKSFSNTMLCPEAEGNYELNILLDKYGYKESSCTTELRALQQLCEQEGCTSYFGIKEKKEETLTGTLFMVNNKLGYTHMLSVQFPIDALERKEGAIDGRLFVYIPLHNISKRFFNQNNYRKPE